MFRPLEGLDPATAEIADYDGIGTFLYDKHGFYLLDDTTGTHKKVAKADASKLTHLYGTLYKDTQTVYYFDPLSLNLRPIEGVRADSFTVTRYRPVEDKPELLYVESEQNKWEVRRYSPFIQKVTKEDGWGEPFFIHYIKDVAATEKGFRDEEYYDESPYRMSLAEIWINDVDILLRKGNKLVRADVDSGTFLFTGVHGENREEVEEKNVFFFMDSRGLYTVSDGKIEFIPNTAPRDLARIFGTSDFFEDRLNVYHWSWKKRKLSVVPGADPATFKVEQRSKWNSAGLKKTSSVRFAIDRNSVFFHDKDTDEFVQAPISLKEYLKLGDYIFLKDNDVFVLDWEKKTLRKVPEADGATFRPGVMVGEYLYLDKNRVFSHDIYSNTFTEISGADPTTFMRVEGRDSTLFKDKNRVYVELGSIFEKKIVVLENADQNTIRGIDYGFAKDKFSVFIRAFNGPYTKIAGAHADTFELLPGAAARDKFLVYYLKPLVEKRNTPIQIIHGADPKTFTQVKTIYDGFNHYFKDKNSIWVSNPDTALLEKINGAIPAVFDFEADSKDRTKKRRNEIEERQKETEASYLQ